MSVKNSMNSEDEFRASWLERNFIRRRFLFYTEGGFKCEEIPEIPRGFYIESTSGRELLESPELKKWVPRSLHEVDGGNITLESSFLFEKGVTGPVGAASVLFVESGAVWYDNVPVLPNEARFLGFEVLPRLRGQGLGRVLHRHRLYRITSRLRADLFSAVVERHRIPSIRIQEKVFENSADNWLIKAGGRNVISLVSGGRHKGLWYVGPGRNCRWRNDG